MSGPQEAATGLDLRGEISKGLPAERQRLQPTAQAASELSAETLFRPRQLKQAIQQILWDI
jgi:hypothetical protein